MPDKIALLRLGIFAEDGDGGAAVGRVGIREID